MQSFRYWINEMLERRFALRRLREPYSPFGSTRGNVEKTYMDRTRQVVVKLVEEGAIEVCQKGEVVEVAEAKGPIRLRKCGKVE
jgi:hypothetical protein